MRIVDQPLFRSRLAIARVRLKIMPQPRIALHVNRALPRQPGILHIVEDEQRAQRPGPRGHRRRNIICIPARPSYHRPRIHIQLHVALHHHRARQVRARGEKQNAAARPRRHIADRLVDLRRLHRLARVVHLVVEYVHHPGVADFRRMLLLRLGKQQQTGALKRRLLVEEDHQVPRPIEVEADGVAFDLRMNAVSQRSDRTGDDVPLVHQRGNGHMHLTAHRKAGMVHPLKLVVRRQAMHKQRLPVHGRLVSQTRRRTRPRGVWSDRRVHPRRQHRKQNHRARQASVSHSILLLHTEPGPTRPAWLPAHQEQERLAPQLYPHAPGISGFHGVFQSAGY